MPLEYTKCMIITHANPKSENDLWDDHELEYMLANENARNEFVLNKKMFPIGDFQLPGTAKRWLVDQASAEAYKELILANATKFNIEIASIDIVDNDVDPTFINMGVPDEYVSSLSLSDTPDIGKINLITTGSATGVVSNP
jgi:hypothetical protein